MKKKFTLHLDALVLITILFVALIGLNVFQQDQINELTKENKGLQLKGLENSFNLSEQGSYIKKLEKQLNTVNE